jgi:hypothetical protein
MAASNLHTGSKFKRFTNISLTWVEGKAWLTRRAIQKRIAGAWCYNATGIRQRLALRQGAARAGKANKKGRTQSGCALFDVVTYKCPAQTGQAIGLILPVSDLGRARSSKVVAPRHDDARSGWCCKIWRLRNGVVIYTDGGRLLEGTAFKREREPSTVKPRTLNEGIPSGCEVQGSRFRGPRFEVRRFRVRLESLAEAGGQG